ncbi:hypothetical protein ACXYTP_17390 [Tsukamurella ocularis]|uniref:hypothetical protein n=1 Tax=Tsukamurella ocularis TaxID=1970234 RepID=UPI0039EE6D2B
MTTEKPDYPDLTTVVGLHDGPDSELQMLAGWTRPPGRVEVPVTLYLPWGIATGVTTFGADFFQAAADAIRHAASADLTAEQVEALANNLYGDAGDAQIEQNDHLNTLTPEQYGAETTHQGHMLRTFVHLRNATTVLGGFRHTHDYLRIRIADVSAWSNGQIEFN